MRYPWRGRVLHFERERAWKCVIAGSVRHSGIDRLDDRAAWRPGRMFTVVDHMLKRAAHALEVGDTGLDLRQSGTRDTTNGTPVGTVLQFQKFTDLLEGEAEFLRAADEAQPRRIGRAVAANAAVLPHRLRQQTAPLVVTDGLHADGRAARERTDSHRIP
jgi:hypothetical protein